MRNVTFGHVATVTAGTSVFAAGMTDIVLGGTTAGGGQMIYATTRPGLGGVSVWELVHGESGGGQLTLIGGTTLTGGAVAGVDSGIGVISGADSGIGTGMMIVTGVGGGLWAMRIGADGMPGARVMLSSTGPVPGDICAVETVVLNGRTWVYTVTPGAGEPSVWELQANGVLRPVDLTASPGAPQGVTPPGITGLAQAGSPATPLLVAISGGADTLIAYRVAANGTLRETDSAAMITGPGIAGPMAVEVVTLGSQQYVLVAGSLSGTLSVFSLAADGTLTLTDHLSDDLASRFANAHVLDVLVIGGIAYVAVAGSDDGISLFRLLPDGTLLHLGSLADTADTSLADVSAIVLTERDGNLHILSTSGSERGISWHMVDPGRPGLWLTAPAAGGVVTGGAHGDLLEGGAGNDRLVGEAGDDILRDGAGVDSLLGGAGADTFIMAADDARDIIGDFEPMLDRIDLSHWPFLRAMAQLVLVSLPGGGEIRFGDESLRIYTFNGATMTVAQMQALDIVIGGRFLPSWITEDMFPVDIPAPPPPPPPPPVPSALTGTPGPDRLTGTEGANSMIGMGNDVLDGRRGADRIWGNGGNDTLIGGGGFDSLWGGDGDDVLWGNAGNDSLEGEAGDDTLSGGIGADTLTGGDGHDVLSGDAGPDLLFGGAGNDTLSGNAGADVLHGDDGNDLLNGGINHDTLYGDGGDDTLLGMNGNDVLYGGAGRDDIQGNAGADLLYGGAGNDTLNGGINHDTLYGEDGNDLLSGMNGADVLYGCPGDDRLQGNAGPDTLDGGAGNDTLNGGLADDVFIFNGGHDVVLDFQNDLDRIRLDNGLWGGGARSVAQVLAGAVVVDGNTVLHFGTHDSLTIIGLTNPAALADDLDIF
ncbi:calcium-binding protein [Oceaniovalibus sp. ACAM 378]|uniref:calcium-binding protein n=1 Tax=Oceaniovalibus sp. ACAM 378 TaxID=2599923 RepID=UPI0011D52646|nr:calcium-binding protein [Oceaniovalibus sp. ACAM 378]TYB84078.1 calcium-binding protein [Oceaniovalibus sp. ACAM 378]